ncbi:hypothetical protein DFH08DRAFT_838302 [Mycena albidolilacea]|uniref:MFS general substrate transporter n=1 Tax=Mycena albidolilacea TaxID=1033008 RepID=A0AAD7ANF9_9AGAR|nr:hypothetical protein DFH08DRAFT_838302 [Mycena albidolilacea]
MDGETSPLLTPTPTIYSNDSDSYHVSQDPRASFSWLIPVVVMASLSDALTTSSRHSFFRQYVCEEIGGLPPHDPPLLHDDGFTSTAFSRLDCSGPPLSSGILSINVASMIVTCLLSGLSTGWWSRFGDMHGRRYALMISVFGSLLLNLIFILITRSPALEGLAQPCIFIGLLLEGLLGGSATLQGAVHAYTADVSPAGSWSAMFSVLQGLFLLCTVLGSGIGLGANLFSPFFSFSISSALGIMNFAFISFFLPESLPDDFRVDRLAKPTLKDVRSSIYSTATSFASSHRLTFYGLAFFIYSLTMKVESFELLIILRTGSAGFFLTTSLLARMATFFILFPALIFLLKRRTPLSLATSTKQYFTSVLRVDGTAARFSVFASLLSQLIITVIPTSSSAIFLLLALMTPLTLGIKPALYALSAVSSEANGDAAKRGALFGAISVVGMVGETLSYIMYVSLYTSLSQSSVKAGFILTAALLTVVGVFLWPGRGSRGESAERVIPRNNTPERIRIVVSDETVRRGQDLLDPDMFSPVYRRHREGGAGSSETGDAH